MIFEDPSILADNNVDLIALANRKRILLSSSPKQSSFRVYCILVVESAGKVLFVEGANAEQGYIGGAICAERAALVQLRQLSSPTIKKAVIVTDSVHPIAPGVLCREFLLSHAHPDTEIVLAGCMGENIRTCMLGQLYPYPYEYRHLHRNEIVEYASNYASSLGGLEECECDAEIHQLHQRAAEAIRYDSFKALHPLQFSAAVLYANGDIEVSWLLKALEYGNSLDPVSQLVVGMERRRVLSIDHGLATEHSTPKMIIMTDQFGVCHAPFAQARSLLTEHGYGAVVCVVAHSRQKGYQTCPAQSLVPPTPTGDLPLTHDDFLCIA